MGGEVQAAPGSVLAGLRKSREKALAKLVLDLKVPGLDAEVFVRYRPVKQAELDKVNARARESKDDDRVVVANAAILALCCQGVFEVRDGQPQGDPSTWPRFDEQLASDLGLTDDGQQLTTSEIVRALYLTDGAVVSTAEAVNAWSFPAIEKREDELAGN